MCSAIGSKIATQRSAEWMANELIASGGAKQDIRALTQFRSLFNELLNLTLKWDEFEAQQCWAVNTE